MPVLRILANGSVAALLLAAAATTATAQDSTLGPFPEGHVSASARKLAPVAAARQKYAIVIGNQAYAHAPQLPNAWNDALDVADLLAGQGYDVTLLKDASKRDFEGLMQRVLFDVDRDDVVAHAQSTVDPQRLAVAGLHRDEPGRGTIDHIAS